MIRVKLMHHFCGVHYLVYKDNLQKSVYLKIYFIGLSLKVSNTFSINKKPGSRPSRSFLIFGHILFLKISSKFLELMKQIAVKTEAKRKTLPFVSSIRLST